MAAFAGARDRPRDRAAEPRRRPRARARRRLALAALGIAAAPALAPAESVRLVLPWRAQAQFAGYYAALDRGLYARHGLDVALVRAGAGDDPVAALQAGEADVAVLLLTKALRARDRGVAVVNCGQVVNRSNLMIVAWRDRGVLRANDLSGRRVSMWDDDLALPFSDFFADRGITVVMVPQHGSVELFLRRGVDACAAMEYNEYHRILQAGVDPEQLTVARLRDAACGPPEDGIYALESLRRASPGTAERFAAASLAGWRWVAQHPEEALDLTMARLRRDRVAGNRMHMKWMLETLLPAIFPSKDDRWTFGRLGREEYARAAARLTEHGLVRGAPPYDAFCPGAQPRAP